MNPKAEELQARTHKFATAVIKFCEGLPNDVAAQKIAGQLLDSAGSTDSNYRATCRARSPDEFIAKIGIAAEEADESKGWLQLLVSSNLARIEDARDLIQESDELTAIPLRPGRRRSGVKRNGTGSRRSLLHGNANGRSSPTIVNPSIASPQSPIRESAICNRQCAATA